MFTTCDMSPRNVGLSNQTGCRSFAGYQRHSMHICVARMTEVRSKLCSASDRHRARSSNPETKLELTLQRAKIEEGHLSTKASYSHS